MNKIEFYNKVVEIYKKTGQGVPKFVSDRAGDGIFEELQSDGLVKLVVKRFNYVPDEETICLTKGYCVEEDIQDNDMSALNNIRIYLNHESIIELGNVLQVTLKEAIQNPDMMKNYSEWLIKNKKKLEEKIELLDESEITELSDEVIDYIKTKGWYTDNCIVSECIKRAKESDDNYSRRLEILNELIKLQSTPSVRDKYKDSLEENIRDKEEMIATKKFRPRINNWLSTKDPNLKIQSLV